jgi:phosphohistidine phosphatase
MRHGQAAWQAESDPQRPLTQQGIAEVRSVAAKSELSGLVEVWCSPYVRAEQSCRTFIESVDAEFGSVKKEALLTPDADPSLLVELIEASHFEQLLLVSHMPLVARLTLKLTSDERIGGFHTAQLVHCVQQMQGEPWRLVAIYSPDAF